MPDKKLTDSEVVKALEICSTYRASCKDCPAFVKVDRSKCKQVLIGAKALINRLQAENERLKEENEIKSNARANIFEITSAYEKGKFEAYKEFAERLCEGRVSNDNTVILAKCLLKELVGDNNDRL